VRLDTNSPALPSKVSDLSRRNSDYATMWQNSADRRVGPALIRKLVQDPEQKQILTLERWLLIHDQGTEAAATALHTDCLSAGS
jgi:hypothetical protein